MIRELIEWAIAPSVAKIVRQVPTCEHKWGQEDRQVLLSAERKEIGACFTLRCEKCGDITFRSYSIRDFYK